MKLILVFVSIMKKIQVDENECEYMSFRIDIYSSECFLAVEIYEKGHADRDLIFEEKRQKAQEKKIGCKFIRLNTSNAKNGYDLDCEVGNVQAFINEFNNKKLRNQKKRKKEKEKDKELEEKLEKEMREKIRKIRKRNERKIRKITKRKIRKKTKRKIKKRS